MAAEYKKKLVKEYQKLVSQYKVIGIVNLHAMPTAQLQQMKQKLKDTVVIIGGRKKLFGRAIEGGEKDKPGLKEIAKYLEEGLPALMFTNENPFLLYKKLSQSKISAPAKAGDIAPKELVIPAGPTPFAPGPIIGELGRLGIKTGVEGGKVAVKTDSTVAKKGDKISADLSSILLRMGIEPMEIGLDLVATYEDGTVFGKDVLEIDETEFMGRLETAAAHAFNLAVNTSMLTKDTTELIVAKAFNDAKALAREQNILADAVAEELVAKASIQMTALKNELKIDEKLAETTKEEPKEEKAVAEEPKKEEKPEEAPKAKEEAKTEEKKEEEKPAAEPESDKKDAEN